ncbi:MAG: hypothetical protein M3Z16_11895 [Pseudomonadota bacterium]|nr:hypothetical protein [Pseudomonadota bacterium]
MRDLQRLPSRWASFAAALALGACAQAGEPAPGVEQRLLLKLVRPSDDGVAIAATATRLAGRPVRYAAAVSPAWHAVVMRCPDQDSCAQGLRALRAAPGVYERVDPDLTARPSSP